MPLSGPIETPTVADPPGAFIPAYPVPHATCPSIPALILGARRDLLSIWWERAYRNDTMSVRMLARQIFICNSPESVKHVMVTNNDNFERKSPQMRRALEFLLGDGLFISDGETWTTRRRFVAPIVHRQQLSRFVPVMVNAALERAEQWAETDTERDILLEMAALTAEIIARAVFGSSLGSNQAAEVIGGFSDYQRHIDQFNLPFFLGADEGWPPFKGPRIRRATRRVRDVVESVVDAHRDGRGDRDSMIAMMFDRRDEVTGEHLSRDAIINEAATIFMAGHETTANTLAWAWYALSQAPWAEAALHEELDRVLDGRAPTIEDVPRLPYTRAIIEETLRLYPPVPILSRQARDADRICGHPVEAGALVMVVPWLLHRHEKHWDRPHHFIPERFIENETPGFCYIPFATGPRICAGASFGLTEAVLCLAVLAQRFRLILRPGHKVQPRCRLTLRPLGGLPMTAAPRS
ncbi:MAG: cytochrome P450 [Alphaproteobacteria bacterium]